MIAPAIFTKSHAGKIRLINSRRLLPVSRRAGGKRARCRLNPTPAPAAGASDLTRHPRSADPKTARTEATVARAIAAVAIAHP